MAESGPKMKMGFQVNDRTGYVQEHRGKRNVAYTDPEGRKFFAKSAQRVERNRAHIVDPVTAMRNEKRLLNKLADTGVTPLAGDLKVYGDGAKVRLLLEMLDGRTLDDPEMESSDSLMRSRAQEVVVAIGQSMARINEHNVLIVDVNEGTFLINDSTEAGIEAKVLDLEIGIDLDDYSEADVDQALRFLESRDFAIRHSQDFVPPDYDKVQLLKAAEVRRVAATVTEWLIHSPVYWNPLDRDLEPPERQQAYEADKAKVRDGVVAEVTRTATRVFEYALQQGRETEANRAKYIDSYVSDNLPNALETVLISHTLEERLQQNNIKLSEQQAQFLTRALSMNVKERPQDFSGLVSG